MFALHQDLFIQCICVIASLELAACVVVCMLDARSRVEHRESAASRREAPDPFATWVSMLDRQRDRRDGNRYGGVERRSKVRFAQAGSN